MSIQSTARFLKAVYALTESEPGAWVEIDAVVATLPTGDQIEIGIRRSVAELWKNDQIELSQDEAHVAITPKGVWMLGHGERPEGV